tara:strand:- start:219 stop:434 length:216 start_codon:yes stop_codon:yes gene_type:complete
MNMKKSKSIELKIIDETGMHNIDKIAVVLKSQIVGVEIEVESEDCYILFKDLYKARVNREQYLDILYDLQN